jgi:hypothetical protein
MKTYEASVRGTAGGILFKGDKEADNAFVAASMALLEAAQRQGTAPINVLTVFCMERPETGSAEATKAPSSGEALTLR